VRAPVSECAVVTNYHCLFHPVRAKGGRGDWQVLRDIATTMQKPAVEQHFSRIRHLNARHDMVPEVGAASPRHVVWPMTTRVEALEPDIREQNTNSRRAGRSRRGEHEGKMMDGYSTASQSAAVEAAKHRHPLHLVGGPTPASHQC
jgi:hypothetical protein